MSSACFIQVDVATALAVTSRGLRVRISRATAAGTMIVCAACRSRSTRPARLRQMSGEVLTTAWSGIGQFSPERIHVDREGIHTLLARDRMKSVRSSPATWAARSCEMRPREYQWTTAFALTHAPCPIDGRWSRNIVRAVRTGLNQNAPPIWSPPLRRPDGRATGTARFQEAHEVALRDANAVHDPHVPQFTVRTERVDATSRYSEALRHVANPQKGSRSVLRTWQQMGSKTLRKACILLQKVGLGGLVKSRDSNNLR